MWKVIQKYWDIFGGATIGLVMTFTAKFQLYKVQLYYSVVILMLVCIGILRILKQAIEKNRGKKRHNVIDSMVDSQRPMKAIRIAQNPTKDGEVLGNLIIKIFRGLKKAMNKLKELFDKFKGIILAVALGILTVIEMCGGHINALIGGALTVGGVELLPVITLACAVVVGILSNGYTKDQREKIKALFSKSCTNEIVLTEIKKSIKDNTAKLTQFNKILATKETELANLNSTLESKKNTYDAKREMFNMVPRLATEEDVQLALNAFIDTQAEISIKNTEIEQTKTTIANLQSTINALKSQL